MSEFNDGGGIGSLIKKWRTGIISTALSRPVPGTVTTKVATPVISQTGGGASGPSVGGLSTLLPPSMRPVSSSTTKNTTPTTESIIQTPDTSSGRSGERKHHPYRISQFENLLQADNVDLDALRKLAWNGVPHEHRPMVWQLLLGYMPSNKERRVQSISRKRKEYFDSIPQYFDIPGIFLHKAY